MEKMNQIGHPRVGHVSQVLSNIQVNIAQQGDTELNSPQPTSCLRVPILHYSTTYMYFIHMMFKTYQAGWVLMYPILCLRTYVDR